MTTTDVFQRAVTAMSTFGDIPLGGEVYGLDVGTYDVRIKLDDQAHPAQGLLSWLYSLSGTSFSGRRLSHHHDGRGNTYVVVQGKRDGVPYEVHAVFHGDDGATLCERGSCPGLSPLPVHRLRAVQMRQLAVAAGVRSLTEALGGVR